jgi:hypothetical protein
MFGLGGLAAKWGLDLLWGRVKTNARNDWAAIPPKARLWLIGTVVAIAAFLLHQHVAHVKLKNQYKDGYKQAQLDDAEKLKNANARIEALSAEIAADERKKFDEARTRIDEHATALQLRGPGKAVCTGPAPAAGGHEARPGTVPAAVARVPYSEWEQLLGVPFPDAVAFAKQSDINAEELRRWHSWYDRLAATWPKPGH